MTTCGSAVRPSTRTARDWTSLDELIRLPATAQALLGIILGEEQKTTAISFQNTFILMVFFISDAENRLPLQTIDKFVQRKS